MAREGSARLAGGMLRYVPALAGLLAVLVATNPGGFFLPSRLAIGVRLMGWSGVMDVAAQSFADRALGQRETLSRKSYYRMLDALSEFDREYLSPKKGVVDDFDIAEGHRLATHMLRIGFEFYVEQDPTRPKLLRLVTPTRKVMGDNPDALYYFAPINSSASRDQGYVVSGRRTGEAYLSLTTYATKSPGGYATRVTGDLGDISYGQDGAYKVYITPERPAGADVDWIRLTADTACVVTRHYFESLKPAAADPNVVVDVRIDPVAKNLVPPVLDDKEMSRRLNMATNYVREHAVHRPNQDPTQSPPWFSYNPNIIGKPAVWSQAGNHDDEGLGAVDIAYGAGFFKLGQGQALTMTGRVPQCAFANVVLWNRWLQTLDYTTHRVSLNRKQLRLGPNGEYKIVVSPKRPPDEVLAEFDWLDSAGRVGGIVFWRFVLPEEDIPQPQTNLIDI